MSEEIFDCIIIGAGASGLFCASRLLSESKNKDRKLKVLLIDKNSSVAKKLRLTGNGRCNFSNSNIELDSYNTDSPEILKNIIGRYDSSFVCGIFENVLGVTYARNEELLYPATFKSETVADSFMSYLSENDVQFVFNSEVSDILVENDLVYVYCGGNSFVSKYAVIGCGGASYPKTGSDGNFYKRLLKYCDRSDFEQILPGLVQLKTLETDIYSLKGIRVKSHIKLLDSENLVLMSDFGELLFTDYGISGIVTMQLSSKAIRYISKTGKKPTISVNLFGSLSADEVFSKLKRLKEMFPDRTLCGAFKGIIDPDICLTVIRRLDISSDTKISEVSERKLMSLSESFIDFRLTIVGSKGFDDAQITTGGLKLSSLNSDLSLKSNSCLYVCGEILNVDGPCGGYNLQWAWSSASCCADSILKRLS